ncbi:uroporphyrinogen decarboxylase, partial [Tremellales sp. Uapishka_1]
MAARLRLANKVCIVTGAASGIGLETSLQFAQEGGHVLLADINEDAASKAADYVNEQYPGCLAEFVKCDVSKEDQVKNMVERAVEKFGRLDVLFNNAGIMHGADDDAINTEEKVWDLTHSINVKGVWFGCKYAVLAMRKNKAEPEKGLQRGGSIINVASFVALMGAATPQLAYTASKGAVLAMTRELAMVHAREGIRFNALCPYVSPASGFTITDLPQCASGPIRTPLLMDFLSTPEKLNRRLIHNPMGRFGEAVEQAKAVVYLASDDSSYTNGAAFTVDGGLSACYVGIRPAFTLLYLSTERVLELTGLFTGAARLLTDSQLPGKLSYLTTPLRSKRASKSETLISATEEMCHEGKVGLGLDVIRLLCDNLYNDLGPTRPLSQMTAFTVPKLDNASTWKDVRWPPLKNDLLLRAAKGEETVRAPVWVMRQAGRYLPGKRSLFLGLTTSDPSLSEFLQVRQSHSFFECCQTPELASTLTLQPIDRYPSLDASIIFCDILVVPQAMGLTVLMEPSKGPVLPAPLVTPADFDRLNKVVDVQKELGYVFEAVSLTRRGLDGRVPLIGFCGAPWTLMAYMVEGGGSKTFQKCKEWLYRYPEESKALLMRIADVCADLLVGQVLAGAQMLQVFDSWAGELTPYHFSTFALPSLLHISHKVKYCLAQLSHPPVSITLFAKGANAPESLKLIADPSVTGYDTLGLDWTVDPVSVREIVGTKVALQGNFDPVILYGGKEGIEREVERLSARWKLAGGGWIANLGHGITPQVKTEDMGWFLDCVHKYSAR